MMLSFEAFGVALSAIAAGLAVASLGPMAFTRMCESLLEAMRPRRAVLVPIPIQTRHPYR